MKSVLSSTAFQVSTLLQKQNILLRRSIVTEISSALLGYKTYAALITEENDEDIEYHLCDAEVLILDLDKCHARVGELVALPASSRNTIVETCVQVLKTALKNPIFSSLDEFYSFHASDLIRSIVVDDDSTVSAMGELNAADWTLSSITNYRTSQNLWESHLEWAMEADCKLTGSYDINSDRMYNGHEISGGVILTFTKAGRSGLIFSDEEVNCGVDYSLMDQDREDEMEYMRSLYDQDSH